MDSVASFSRAVAHEAPEYEAEAYYNRSKAHWRLWRVTNEFQEFEAALKDAQVAARRFYDNRFESWVEFLKGNVPPTA